MIFKRTTRVQCIMVTSLGQVEAAPSAWSSPWVRYLAVGKLDNNNLSFITAKNLGFFKNYSNGIVVCRIEYCLMTSSRIHLDVNTEL